MIASGNISDRMREATFMWVYPVDLLVSFFQTYFTQSTILYVTKTPCTNKRLLLSAFCLTVAYAVIAEIVESRLLVVFWIMFVVLSYFLFFRATIVKSLLLGLGQLLFVTGVEYILIFAVNVSYRFISVDFQNPLHQMIARSFNLVLILIIRYIAQRIVKPFSLQIKPKRQSFWAIYLLFMLLFTLPNILHIENNNISMYNRMGLYNVILFMAFFIYNIINAYNLNKMANISLQLETQLLHNESLNKNLDKVRGFKHDFANIICTIDGLVSLEDWDSLRSLVRNMDMALLNVTTPEVINAQLKNNPYLYGIVLSKMQIAEIHGVNFHIFLQKEITLEYCDPLDFSRMVGILLDNALEAAAEPGERFVNLDITFKRGRYTVSIQNSCKGPVDIDMITQKGFTTKEAHSGLGLNTVTELIEKYKKRGYAIELKLECHDGVFMQKLII